MKNHCDNGESSEENNGNTIKDGKNINITEKTKNNLKSKISIIESSKFKSAYGIFCKIPFQNKSLKVLITNNHILNLSFFNENNEIKLEINKQQIILSLEVERKIWTNDYMNYTVIELLEKDKIKNSFFIIDEKKYNSDIIFPVFNENEEISFYKTEIVPIQNDSNYFHDNCNIDYVSSGEPYILNNNYSLIGIHIGYDRDKKTKTMEKMLEF